jgi:hypothetical protein
MYIQKVVGMPIRPSVAHSYKCLILLAVAPRFSNISLSLTLKVYDQGKVKLSLYRPWRPIGLREVEAPTFSLDSRLKDGGKVVNPTRRPLFTPRKIPGTHFC